MAIVFQINPKARKQSVLVISPNSEMLSKKFGGLFCVLCECLSFRVLEARFLKGSLLTRMTVLGFKRGSVVNKLKLRQDTLTSDYKIVHKGIEELTCPGGQRMLE